MRAGKQISQHFGLTDSISFDRIDLVGGAHSKLSAIKGKVVFTYYCLEQLKYDTSTVILNIRNACPKRVIHIEPTVEMYDLLSPKDLANYLYSRRMDYQDNLLGTLRSVERRGALKILGARRLYYAPTIRHDPTLICWEPVSVGC